jgi:hypothetical protein
MPYVDATTQTTALPAVEATTQTTLAGPINPPYIPPTQFPTDTTTPPAEKADMPSSKLGTLNQDIPAITETKPESPSGSPSKRKRPDLVARISIPPADLEGRKSPPPTHAVLSPLPAINKLHAGHTPLFPGHFSPAQEKEKSEPGTPTPVQDIPDVALTGPLTLPAQPGDGAADRIELKVLDAELEKIAQEQEECKSDVPASVSVDSAFVDANPTSDGESAESIGSPNSVEVDGVLLKKPRMNLGAPLGQV